MKKRAGSLVLVAMTMLLSTCAGAESGGTTYLLRPTYTNVTFTITKWMVMREQGQFRDFTGELYYDAERPELSKVNMTVQAASIDTKNETRDGVLRSDDFFDVARYPTLSFRSTGVKRLDAATLEVTGEFTVHGKTKVITIPVKMMGTHEIANVGRLAGFETQFTINRRDYGVLGTRWGAVPGTLGDEVEIHILAGAIKPK